MAKFLGVSYDTAEGRLRQPRKAANAMLKDAEAEKLPAAPKSSCNRVSKPEGRGMCSHRFVWQTSHGCCQGKKRTKRARSPADSNLSDEVHDLWEDVLAQSPSMNPTEMHVDDSNIT